MSVSACQHRIIDIDGYGEAKYTTIELLRGFSSFLSINVKKYHKNRIVA